MRFLKYLNEDYVATGKGLEIASQRTNSFPIYKNPDSSDYKEMRKKGRYSNIELMVRCVVDLEHKNLYVWDALEGVHIEGLAALKNAGEIKYGDENSVTNIFCGGPDVKGNKLSGDALFSFLEYMLYYGLGSYSPIGDYDLKGIEKRAQWMKKYFHGNIEARLRNGKPCLYTG